MKTRSFTVEQRFFFGLMTHPMPPHGVYELDREREARRSGVPPWWRPQESRRKRCASYAEHRRRMQRERPMVLGVSVRFYERRIVATLTARARGGVAPT